MKMFLIYSIILVILCCGQLFSQEKIDLTGTWKGSTYVEGADIELMMTLVLEHKGGVITGKLNDDMGYIGCPITEAKLVNNVLTFKAVAMPPEGETPMSITMTVTGDKMEGKWEADIYTGSWTATKQKEVKIDFTGTWIGPINTPDGEDNATWTIKYENGVFSGSVTDEFGYMNNAPIKNFVLENDKITFDIVVSVPEGDMMVKVKGTFKDNSIEGTWEIVEMGESGTWSAKKK